MRLFLISTRFHDFRVAVQQLNSSAALALSLSNQHFNPLNYSPLASIGLIYQFTMHSSLATLLPLFSLQFSHSLVIYLYSTLISTIQLGINSHSVTIKAILIKFLETGGKTGWHTQRNWAMLEDGWSRNWLEGSYKHRNSIKKIDGESSCKLYAYR